MNNSQKICCAHNQTQTLKKEIGEYMGLYMGFIGLYMGYMESKWPSVCKLLLASKLECGFTTCAFSVSIFSDCLTHMANKIQILFQIFNLIAHFRITLLL